MADRKTEHLRFSAYSIKDLIVRKLSEDTKWTDQVYEGSNLTTLIDLVAYMYQCLMYQLNTAAAESMFADTQIYENINRLSKFIGYSPRGCEPAQLVCYFDNMNDTGVVGKYVGQKFPRFAYINTGLADSTGNQICFSLVEDYSVKTNRYQTLKLYNGRWKLYSTVFTASGDEYETFVLDGIQSNQDNRHYVAHRYIQIFVQDPLTGKIDSTWHQDFEEIFVNTSSENRYRQIDNDNFTIIYNKDEPVYHVRLNEAKTYEIKFGDGIVGRKLKEGSRVYVFYLDTNGPDGKIDPAQFPDGIKLHHTPSDFGISKELYKNIFGEVTQLTDATGPVIYLKSNLVTDSRSEETVEQVRENAPNWFKTGSRLITRTDYEYYLKNGPSYSSIVVDAKCMNNWEYLATFYKWLYDMGLRSSKKDGRMYIDRDILDRNYQYIDAADGNNIYLFVRTSADTDEADKSLVSDIQNNILDDASIQSMKTMTAELVILPTVTVHFAPCAAPDTVGASYFSDYLTGDKATSFMYDVNGDSYIEVTLADDNVYVTDDIKEDIARAILDYFAVNKCRIGQTVKYDEITKTIYDINGVERVRTVYSVKDDNGIADVAKSRTVDGVSFASWTAQDNYIEIGSDLAIGNTTRQLEKFQWPMLAPEYDSISKLVSRIKVIKKSLTNINTIKF